MAEYYPLISRAVAGLRTATPDARRAIYDRAKQALLGQLRAMQPPIPEEDIDRETVALDEAIARVEADVVSPKKPDAAAPAPKPAEPSSRPVPPPAPAAPPPVVAVSPAAAPPGPAAAAPAAPPVLTAASASADTTRAPTLGGFKRTERPALSPRPTLPPLRPSTVRPPSPAPRTEEPRPPEPLPAVSPASEVDALAKPKPVAAPEQRPEPSPADAIALPVAPVLEVPEPTPPVPLKSPALRQSQPDGASATAATDERGTARSQEDGVRPAAPRPNVSNRPDLRVFIVAVAALAAVIAVAFTAWKLRDRPEELARTPSISRAAEPATGKIAERADGSSAASDENTGAGGAAGETAGSAAQGSTAVPGAPAAAGAPASAVGAASATDPSLPVAYKAAILVDAPDEPQKVKTFVGTVVWRTETVNPGQDQPVSTAIRGDIDIPEAKIQLVFEMRKNIEPQFPASHTLELKFTVGADSPIGGIKQINVPQMRREDMPTGDPLAGVPVTITDNYFLVGLTRGGFEDSNLDLIKTRNWFDIPMLLSTGKAAKITFEKGAAGERIVDEAVEGWKSSPN